jgi:hypothetical protein
VFEIRFGIDLLPRGKRRDALDAAFETMLRDDLNGRVAAFDAAAAEESAKLAARRQLVTVLSTSGTHRSPGSRSRGGQAWPRATCAISTVWT